MLPIVSPTSTSTAKATKETNETDDTTTALELQKGDVLNAVQTERTKIYETHKDLQELCRDNGITCSHFAKKAIHNVTTLDMFMGFWPSMKSIMYFPALKELSIIKHPTITRIEGLSACVQLELLCITECGLEQMEELQYCTKLRHLNLSSNHLRTIKHLDQLEHLQVVWLNDNQIETLGNVSQLKQLTTLWICRNQIEELEMALYGCNNLTELNLADNRISNFKSLLSLGHLEALTKLTLNDPHYGDNPVCRLCNYQTYVLCQLNRLEWLDTIQVSSRTKLIAEATMMKKKMYYNMRIKAIQRDVQQRLDHIKRIRTTCEHELKMNISALIKHKEELENVMDGESLQTKLDAIETCVQEKCIKLSSLYQDYELVCTRFKSISDQKISSLLLELETGGNIRLEDGTSNDMWYTSCVDLIKTRLFSSDLHVFGIRDIQIQRVTRITNRYLRNRFHARIEELLAVNETHVKENVSKKGVTVISKDDADQDDDDDDEETNTGASSYQKRVAAAQKMASVPDNSLEYLFYMQEPVMGHVSPNGTVPLEQFHTAEYGFRSPETYRALGLDSAIRLSDSVSLLDTHRLLATYTAKGKQGLSSQEAIHFSTLTVQQQDKYSWSQEIRESAKQVANGAWELPTNVLVVVKVFPGFSKVLSETEEVQTPVESHKYPGLHSIQAIKGRKPSIINTSTPDDTKQKMYYVFDKTLVLPEYIVEYSYLPISSPIQTPSSTPESIPATTIQDRCPSIQVAEAFEHKYRTKMSETDPVVSSPSTPSLMNRHRSPLDENVIKILEMEPIPKTKVKILEIPLHERIQQAQVNQLTHLNLYTCALETIPNLRGIPLTTLILSNNRLSYIDVNLCGITSLTHLDLSHNQLTRLDHLDGLLSLTRLELHHNQIKSFETIQYLHQVRNESLSQVDLRKNPICDTKRYRLHVLYYLTHLTILDQVPIGKHERWKTQQLMTHMTSTMIWKHYQSTKVPPIEQEPCFTAVERIHIQRQLISTLDGLTPFLNLRIAMFPDNLITSIQGLETCQRLEELSLEKNCLTKVDDLHLLSQLKYLNLSYNAIFGNLEFIHGLENLTHLCVEDNQITSLQGIGTATKLMELYLRNNRIQNLKEVQHLKTLPKLTILELSGNPLTQATDYRLYSVYYLRRMKILDGTSITIQDQSDAKQKYSGKLTLEFIIEKYHNTLSSPRGMGTLERIQVLDLSSCRIRELGVISGKQFCNLQELNLENNQIQDIMGLESFSKLRILNLNRNRIESFGGQVENRGIMACLQLEQLFLAYNGITDMTSLGLHHLIGLQVLHLQGNSIVTFHGLEKNMELIELRLDHNKIRQLESFTHSFRKLKVLSMEDNGLKTLSPWIFPMAEYINVSNNRLMDLEELDKVGLLSSLLEIRFHGNPMTKKHLYRQNVLYHFPTLINVDGRDVTTEERERVEVLFAHERNAALLTLDRPILHNRDLLTISPSTIPTTKPLQPTIQPAGARTMMPQLSTSETVSGSRKNSAIPNQPALHTFTKSDPIPPDNSIAIASSKTTSKSLLSSTAYRNQVMSNSNQTNVVMDHVEPLLLNTGGENFNVKAPIRLDRRRIASIQYDSTINVPVQQGPSATTKVVASTHRATIAATNIIHPLSADLPNKLTHSNSGTATSGSTINTSSSTSFSGYVVACGNQKRYTSFQEPTDGIKNILNGRPK